MIPDSGRPRPDPSRLLFLQASGARDLIGEAIDAGTLHRADAFKTYCDCLRDKGKRDLHAEAARGLSALARRPEFLTPANTALIEFLQTDPPIVPFKEAVRGLACSPSGRALMREHISPRVSDFMLDDYELAFLDLQIADPELLVKVYAARPEAYCRERTPLLDAIARTGVRGLLQLSQSLDPKSELIVEGCAYLASKDPGKLVPALRGLATNEVPAIREGAIKALGCMNDSADAAKAVIRLLREATQRAEARPEGESPENEVPPSGFRGWIQRTFRRNAIKESPPPAAGAPQVHDAKPIVHLLDALRSLSLEKRYGNPLIRCDIEQSDEVRGLLEADAIEVSAVAFERITGRVEEKAFNWAAREVKDLWEDLVIGDPTGACAEQLLRQSASGSISLKLRIARTLNDACWHFSGVIEEWSRQGLPSDGLAALLREPPTLAEDEAQRRLGNLREKIPALVFRGSEHLDLLVAQLELTNHLEGYDQEIIQLACNAFELSKDEWVTRESLRALKRVANAEPELWPRIDRVIEPNAGYVWQAVDEAIGIIVQRHDEAHRASYIPKLVRLSHDDSSQHVRTVALRGLQALDPTLSFEG